MDSSERTFQWWKQQVDMYLENVCGLTSDDLPDVDYRQMHDDGETPKHAGNVAIRAAGFKPEEL